MEKKNIVTSIQVEERLIDAIQAIKENQSRCVMIKSNEKVVGVISEGDVMRALLQGIDIHAPLYDWISYDFKFLKSYDKHLALDLMRKYGITMVPVIDENFMLIEVITLQEILEDVMLPKE